MAKDLFNRYIWLADTIYRAGKITFEEITEKWNKSALNSGEELTLRTFHNHRNAVETLFDIDIECTKSGGYYYYIKNSDDLDNSGVKQWMLSSLTVRNLINESAGLKDRILFEEMPSGKEYLSPIIEAMKENIVLDVHYQSFKADEPKSYIIEPYCVKIFKQRWYLIGRDVAKNQVHIYGLDRIHKINYTKLKFKYPPRFNPKEFLIHALELRLKTACVPILFSLKWMQWRPNILGHYLCIIPRRRFRLQMSILYLSILLSQHSTLFRRSYLMQIR